MSNQAETVLVLGVTGNIGISAVLAVLRSGRNVLAVVRNADSAKRLLSTIGAINSEGVERITIVETDVVSDTGVQGVVDQVRAGKLPAFQHVHSTIGGGYTDQTMLEVSKEEFREFMTINFESNLWAYRATIPYLLEQKDRICSWTTVTGSQGETGERALPAISQGAAFAMCNAAVHSLANTNVRFNEIYLDARTEIDDVAEAHGTMKASVFSRVYEKILAREEIKGERVRVFKVEDVDELVFEKRFALW